MNWTSIVVNAGLVWGTLSGYFLSLQYIAFLMANGAGIDEIPGAGVFSDGPRGVSMNAIFLKPLPITEDNLDVVIDAGWVTKATVCQGVPAGRVSVCD